MLNPSVKILSFFSHSHNITPQIIFLWWLSVSFSITSCSYSSYFNFLILICFCKHLILASHLRDPNGVSLALGGILALYILIPLIASAGFLSSFSSEVIRFSYSIFISLYPFWVPRRSFFPTTKLSSTFLTVIFKSGHLDWSCRYSAVTLAWSGQNVLAASHYSFANTRGVSSSFFHVLCNNCRTPLLSYGLKGHVPWEGGYCQCYNLQHSRDSLMSSWFSPSIQFHFRGLFKHCVQR